MTSTKTKLLFVTLLCALMACALVLGGCGSNAQSSSASSSKSASSSTSASKSASSASSANYISSVSPDDPYGTGIHHATLTVEGYDPITITLDADAAPVTVANFCNLANDGFYNGLTFYRFVQDFCMQGGSSNNSAAIVNDGVTPIVGEFAQNNKTNPLANDFKKGTVAMARSGNNMNSATSTFFVTLASSPAVSQSLNGQYAAFGTIDEAGMAIVDQIVAAYLPKVTDPQMGSIDNVADQAKIVSIQIVD